MVRTGFFGVTRKIFFGLAVMVASLIVLMTPRSAEADLNIFTVDRSDDPAADPVADNCTAGVANDCTLRGAITKANERPNDAAGPDEIRFNIPGTGPHTISPTPSLPNITSPVTIDGYTQTGASEDTATTDSAVLKIELRGDRAGFASGLTVGEGAGGTKIRGLVINRFGATGVVILAENTVVEGNFVGTNTAGDADSGNGLSGVSVGSSGNLIGGTSTGAKNIISGNGDNGVVINGLGASNNRIEGNRIGTNANGTSALGNGQGVNVTSASGNFVGGSELGAGNIISGNTGRGILLAGDATDNSVQSNRIGTDVFGSADLGNGDAGVEIFEGSNNVIGGTASRTGNIISGNDTDGVELNLGASNNRVQGNLIGTGQNGASDLGNGSVGVRVLGPDNFVGGTASGARNVISGNDGNGVSLLDAGATGNRVQGNRIGTDFFGTADLGNGSNGVFVDDAVNNTIGGTTSGAGNTISGNEGNGVFLDDSPTTDNRIEGNLIGTTSRGTGDVGNTRNGVRISGAPSNFVGGSVAGAVNVISGNDEQGVQIIGASATGNRVLRNSIFDNGLLGIELNNDGVTLNDGKDPDTGPNKLQNFPEITSASTTTIKGTLKSHPRKTFTIQLFSNPAPNFPTGFGEGQTFLGQISVRTNRKGKSSFTFDTTLSAEQVATATATDASGNTSEFSRGHAVQ